MLKPVKPVFAQNACVLLEIADLIGACSSLFTLTFFDKMAIVSLTKEVFEKAVNSVLGKVILVDYR